MLRVLLRPRVWGWLLLLSVVLWISSLATQLYRHSQQPVDAILVLGGSIRREIVIAEAVAQGRDSTGADFQWCPTALYSHCV